MLKIITKWFKNFKMVQIGPKRFKWSGMVQNGQECAKLSKIVPNDLKWSQIVHNNIIKSQIVSIGLS